ncbi:MAG: KH domain-containing protein [Coriobacteriia bacterium]|nr:KH domain-containing protein [Coriobacteriia bacterium]
MARTADTDELLRFLVTSLVDDQDNVSIARRSEGDRIAFEISVNPDDIGKVIGRQGRIIKSIRTLMRAAGSINGEHIDVDVLG